MRIAIIYWYTSSVGGIATHLNSLRTAGIKQGDEIDILHSKNWKRKPPRKFPERAWIRGGDTRIWVDGEVSHGPACVEESVRWIESNYDAIVFGFICPHKTKAYPDPDFLPFYDINLPKIAWVMDGYWADYSHWAEPLLPKLQGVLCPLASYASPLTELGYERIKISAFPFQPMVGAYARRSDTPLLVWPNQWKNIKGITQFLGEIPKLPPNVKVQLYSNGIRYYQLRTEDVWRAAVKSDYFQEFDGHGRAEFFGNVDVPEIARAYQRAWWTVNLQGMTTKRATYTQGSYNNTEVEALFYGACPILHASTRQTRMPDEVYLQVSNAGEIPEAVRHSFSFARDERRQRLARDYVLDNHLASHRYRDMREMFDV